MKSKCWGIVCTYVRPLKVSVPIGIVPSLDLCFRLPFFPVFFCFPPLLPLPLLRASATAAAVASATAAAVASAARTALASSARPRMTRFGGALTQGQTWPRKIVGKSFVLRIKIAKKTRRTGPRVPEGGSSFLFETRTSPMRLRTISAVTTARSASIAARRLGRTSQSRKW